MTGRKQEKISCKVIFGTGICIVTPSKVCDQCNDTLKVFKIMMRIYNGNQFAIIGLNLFAPLIFPHPRRLFTGFCRAPCKPGSCCK